jgi:sigma-B regulation protein RsbU (phosphoserine phosphatase)
MHVGGDLYDFVLRRGGPLTFVAGDVSGKGAAAALLMSMTHALFRSTTGAPAFTPADIVAHVNTHLYEDLSAVASFVTLFVGQFQPRSRCLAYANAGHAPVIYFRRGRAATLLEADGPAVGIMPATLSDNHALSLEPGDVLVVATDGFNEAQDERGEMYGIERMLGLVETLAAEPAQQIALGLYKDVDAFAEGRAQDDDQTLLVLKGVNA